KSTRNTQQLKSQAVRIADHTDCPELHTCLFERFSDGRRLVAIILNQRAKVVDLRARVGIAAKCQVGGSGGDVKSRWGVALSKKLRVENAAIEFRGLFRIRHCEPDMFETRSV